MKISLKFLFIILFVTFLLGITALSGVLLSTHLLEQEINGKYLAVSAYAMEKVHRLFSGRFEDLRQLANEPELKLRDSSPANIAAALRAYKKHYRAYAPYASLSFFTLDRTRIADTEGRQIGLRHPLTGYWQHIARGEDKVLDIAPANIPAGEVFRLACVVRDDNGVPFGVVVARIPVASMRMLVERPLKLFKLGLVPQVDLVDRSGRILYSTHNQVGNARAYLPAFLAVRQALATGEGSGVLLRPKSPGKKLADILIYSREEGDANYPGNHWILTISVPQRLALAPMIELRNRLILIILIIGFTSAGIAYLLSKTITRPLVRLGKAASAVGEGRLDIAVKVTSRDEVGRLASTFNAMVGRLGELNRALQLAATVDKLTGALNRSRIEQVLESEMERAKRYSSPLSLLLFDLDHFKRINDSHGHQVGDEALKVAIAAIGQNIRTTDSLGRWGGEEFLLLAPGTDARQAAQLAEKIRQSVEYCSFGEAGRITISCGVAQMCEADSEDSLLKRADDALYAAKRQGRNRVEVCAPA